MLHPHVLEEETGNNPSRAGHALEITVPIRAAMGFHPTRFLLLCHDPGAHARRRLLDNDLQAPSLLAYAAGSFITPGLFQGNLVVTTVLIRKHSQKQLFIKVPRAVINFGCSVEHLRPPDVPGSSWNPRPAAPPPSLFRKTHLFYPREPCL